MADTLKIPGGTIEREALKAEVARLEADNTAIGEDQEAMSKQLAAAQKAEASTFKSSKLVLERLNERIAEVDTLTEQLAAAESRADDLNVLVLEQADKITLLRAVAEAAEGFVACMDSLNHAGEVDGIADSQQMALSPP